MTHKTLIDYFESLNTLLVDFGENSFFRMDLSEITGAFRSGITFPAMAVESPDGDLEDTSNNNSVLGKDFAFTVYKKPTSGNYEEQNQFLDDCETIGLKIIARMRYDAMDNDHFLYNRFDPSTVNYIKVGPIFNENLFGYRFTGKIKGSKSLQINPEDWSDLNSPCP